MDLYGSNAILRNPEFTYPTEKIPIGDVVGRIRVAYDSFDLSNKVVNGVVTALADGDLIHMMNVPNTAKIVQAYVNFDDVGASGTFSAGIIAPTFLEEGAGGTSVGTLFNALAPNGAIAVQSLASGAQANKANLFQVLDDDYTFGIKATAAVTNTSGILRMAVWFVLD